MRTRKRLSIEDWIQGVITDTEEKGAPCTMLSLVYVKSNGIGQEEVFTKPLVDANGQSKPINHSELSKLFENRAVYHVQDLGGVHTFRLLAFYGSTEPKAVHTFTVADGDLTNGEVAHSKFESSEKGLIGQLMQHNREIMSEFRNFASFSMDLAKTYAVASMSRQRELENDAKESLMVVRDAVLSARKESFEMEMKKLEFARQTGERRMLGEAIPGFINAATGREVIAQETADTKLLDAMAMKIRPEHILTLVQIGIIDKNQAAVLQARFNQTREKMEAERKALANLPPEEPRDAENGADNSSKELEEGEGKVH